MHTIEIKNIRNNDNFRYSFIVVKGYVRSKRENQPSCKNQTIVVITNKSAFYTSQLHYNKFKQLIELNPGENNLTISYCCVNLSIMVMFVPPSNELSVVPLYIICDGHNGHFQAPVAEISDPASALKRINTGIKLIQTVIAEKLHELGLSRKTFRLEDCLIFRSKLFYKHARKMNQNELWNYFAKEIINSVIGSNQKKYIGFVSCTKYTNGDAISYEDMVNKTEAHVALGGGGLALFGTACLYTWPSNVLHVSTHFENQALVTKGQFMDDSCYRGTLGYCFSTTLGSVLHELCHTFDLGHTENGVMGRGFDNIHKVFLTNDDDNQNKLGYLHRQLFDNDQTYWTQSCAVFLYYHRWFNNYNANIKHKFYFDVEKKLLKSTAGIRVIELREVAKEMVLQSWTFTGRILKFSFGIPGELFSELKHENVLIVTEDNVGNILKENVGLTKFT